MVDLGLGIVTIAIDGERWRKLMSLCGSIRDGSQTTVKLYQDDATGTVSITVGNSKYTGHSFEEAIDSIPD